LRYPPPPSAAGRENRIPPHYDTAMPGETRRGRPPHNDVLTPTEWRILHAVQHGLTNRQIADRRGTSVDAVKFHVANVLAKFGVRNRRELRKLSRRPAGSAMQRRPGVSADPRMRLGQLGQIARSVRNVAESEAWYRDVLGLPHLFTYGTMAFFDLAGTRLMLSQTDAVAGSDSLLYFATPDIDVAHEVLGARGVRFLNAPHLIHRHSDGTEEWMCFFNDPDGRPLGLISRAKPA
jgi:DNA-binding CsgD family transcriptional regulator/catechol 2,3-dioxygenase-like lactoylglutathione lyase family enzyme